MSGISLTFYCYFSSSRSPFALFRLSIRSLRATNFCSIAFLFFVFHLLASSLLPM